MAEERTEVTGRELLRWLVVLIVLVVGIALYFAVGRRTPAVVQAPQLEAAP
ncbi:MAG TPA: hypothetical protein VFK09_09035 [Gemmatimonadales bacterium]|jgi:hypothetical protein|nr:hypothetical protein [Gemmatimonadales bacterium]